MIPLQKCRRGLVSRRCCDHGLVHRHRRGLLYLELVTTMAKHNPPQILSIEFERGYSFVSNWLETECFSVAAWVCGTVDKTVVTI